MRGQVVSPVTSYIAAEPGTRPSRIGLRGLTGQGAGYGSGAGRLASSNQLFQGERLRPRRRIDDDRFSDVLAGHPDEEVGGRDRTGGEPRTAVRGDVETESGHGLDAFRRGRPAVVEEPGGVHVGVHPDRRQPVAEQRLGHRGAAGVARAHDEQVDGSESTDGSRAALGGGALCASRRVLSAR